MKHLSLKPFMVPRLTLPDKAKLTQLLFFSGKYPA
jgi:hypothetical protein